MGAQDETPVDGELIGERRHLLSLAFRMLGIVADAEDAVQETYIRWYRMGRPERDAIEVPRAWLTRVASRVCLDMLGSARARRERYVGPWLPEPVPTSTFRERVEDPLDRVALDETVSTALLVVLEAMTPAERVAFVLHDVFRVPFPEIADIVGRTPAACRQLASSARARVQAVPSRQVPRREHDEVVRRFAAAAQTGDLGALVTALDPAVVLRSDGGGIVSAARKPIRGADKVARFLLGVLAKSPRAEVLEQDTHDGLGFAIWREGRITGVVTLDVLEGSVTDVRMVVNPEKLSLWASEG
ncbi:RNA polymerase sigma factor SigJ [Frigoribacterium sp. CFBP 13729]|uniref:RNA polymerase sigma factor SigJ n=1 Tax=unclassified Frigoribacterium TaxID=2627005 RepID=UPI0017871B4B|nr:MULTISPECIES: RNA polymerase sigma factor SigJ [unclassified Frigoribacterium]MBD8586163.1 RNA polymerase sigma factor SigJ [Frigoribacterium sp. CFBP 8766]MBD8612077.1 RNA polymerase sigma factor SigJ [Frigoribacterium sp. CFBP 13729]